MPAMSDTWNGIVSVAGKVLVTKVPGQLEPHRYAQDCALRIVRTIDHLVKAMPTADRPKRVDLVRIAALYACIGLEQHPAKGGGRHLSSHEAINDAAELAADQLEKLLPTPDIDLTLRILHEHRTKQPKLPEAKLLSDAVAMEEVGMVGLWNQTRATHNTGRTLDHLIKLWRTQREYGYWETRLRDGFHFEISRKVARARLEAMEPIFERMLREHLADDIA